MIEELHLRSLGVIDEATIRLGPGLTVVTGETGAGKTMLLTGLSLVMGGRAEGSMVRGSADRADVDGQWLIAEGTAVAAAVEELGGAVDRSDEGIQVILGRTVSGTGRSKAFAGGRSVPASALAELTAGLVTVHGQSDQLQLKDTRNQRALLDRFAGQELTEVLADFSSALVRLRQAERERDELLAQRQEREREAVLLRHGIEEIAAVQPESGEDASLKQQASALANVTDLLEAMGSTHQSLTGGDGGLDSALDLLVKASRDLDRAAGFDASVRPLHDSLGRVMDELSVLAGEVAHYAATLDADPARLAEVEERRRQVNELMRRYGPRLDDVLE
ncbi:MAG: AAA family ATPase, partial [Candidatus Nanopelagicales bacterium]